MVGIGRPRGEIALRFISPVFPTWALPPCKQFEERAPTTGLNNLIKFIWFSRVLSFAGSGLVLNLVPDPVQAIKEMKRVVRRSGVVTTYIWDIDQDGHPASLLVNGFTHLDSNTPRFGGGGKSIESEQDILQLFEESELTNLSTNRIEISVRHASFDAYWEDALVSQGPPGAYLKRMSSEELNELKTVMIKTVPTNNLGEVVYPACAWAIRGAVH